MRFRLFSASHIGIITELVGLLISFVRVNLNSAQTTNLELPWHLNPSKLLGLLIFCENVGFEGKLRKIIAAGHKHIKSENNVSILGLFVYHCQISSLSQRQLLLVNWREKLFLNVLRVLSNNTIMMKILIKTVQKTITYVNRI